MAQKKNIIIILLLLFGFISLYFNIHLFNENKSIKSMVGRDYFNQHAEANSIVNVVVFEKKVSELLDGDVKSYDVYRTRVNSVVSNIKGSVGGYYNRIALSLDEIASLYEKGDIKAIEVKAEYTKSKIIVMNEIYSKMEETLGLEDVKWYGELTNSNSEINNFINDKFEFFNK
ncbi:hypothetical protein BKP35_12420 [Anaerobacillus arseniciselenatis]|uniref:Uncharacterized protein n=1 Tax=Anaerobacillus arseniciselenatis TaxID=85682 RepID=A0A1S2LFH1_9BACI|nr:hypothetical protein [Anaerobacillus arseniciselenatis]OIJ11116.1 hypothetical protein BKP35_12420 [Anaerobacillus arseniciselenatis]